MTTLSETLKFQRSEFKRSQKWREENHDKDWRRWIDLYRGKHYSKLLNGDQLVVNMIFATKNVMGPAVAINNPRFTVNARNFEQVDQAIIVEEVLNYEWRANRYQADFRLAVDDFILIGHGWEKVGYKFTKKPKIVKVEDDDGDDDDEGIDDREDKEGNVESELAISDDRPFAERISPFDMFVDPDARHPKEMRWIAQRTWRAVSDVRADSRYSKTNRERVNATGQSSREDGRDSDAKPEAGETKFCEVIEFYDLRRNTVSTFAVPGPGATEDDTDGFLIKPKEIPYSKGHPFLMLRNYEVPDTFYPIGDVEQIESLQRELNATRNQIINHRKRYSVKYVVDEDLLDSNGIAALESDQDNVVIRIKNGSSATEAVAVLQAAQVPPEFYNQSGMISSDIDRVSGISDYDRGGNDQNIRRTATEAAMIQDSANARSQDRLAKIEGFLSDLGERIICLMQQYMTGEHVARIVTIPGARAWVPYTKEHIDGVFDFEVQGGSTEPRNETFRRQSALQMVDASTPFLQMGVANPAALFEHILQNGFGVKDVGRFLQQAPPPEQGGGDMQGAPPPMQEQQGLPAGPMPGAPPMDPMIAQILPPEVLSQIPPEIAAQLTPEVAIELMARLSGDQQVPPGAMPPGL